MLALAAKVVLSNCFRPVKSKSGQRARAIGQSYRTLHEEFGGKVTHKITSEVADNMAEILPHSFLEAIKISYVHDKLGGCTNTRDYELLDRKDVFPRCVGHVVKEYHVVCNVGPHRLANAVPNYLKQPFWLTSTYPYTVKY